MDADRHSIFLISVDKEELYENYLKTVKSPVSIDFLHSEARIKTEAHPKLSIWGLNPTKDNIQTWNEIKISDIALFYRNGVFFSKGYIINKFRNKDVPSKMWENELFGKSWEYIILIDKLVPINIDFASALVYFITPTMPNKYVFSIKKIDDYKIRLLVSNFGTLDKAIESLSRLRILNTDVISEIDSIAIPNEIKFNLKSRISKYRIGQDRFNKLVLANYSNLCAVCGIDEPEILEASHIVPVEDQEFGGLIENGISMCVLHHTMFDKGYFSFDNDYRVTISQHKTISQKIKEIIPEGQRIYKAKVLPSKEFLALHRVKFGITINGR